MSIPHRNDSLAGILLCTIALLAVERSYDVWLVNQRSWSGYCSEFTYNRCVILYFTMLCSIFSKLNCAVTITVAYQESNNQNIPLRARDNHTYSNEQHEIQL